MAARNLISVIRAVWGGDINTLIAEHNKLVDEVEELKANYKKHYHSANTNAAAIADGGSVTNSQTFTAADAQKLG